MTFEKILKFLDGKKVIISGCIMAVFAYLTQIGVVTTELNALIATLVTLIFGTASVQTQKILGVRKK